MKAKVMGKPSRLDFTPEQVEALIERLSNQCLEPRDYPFLAELIRAIVWMNFSLQEKQLSIHRLRSIFGIKTESAKRLMEFTQGETPPEEAQENKNPRRRKRKPPLDKQQGHGHRPSSDYTNAKTVEVAHEVLKKGSICPACLKGRLFQLKPGTVLRIVGQPWLQVEIYRPERFRCPVCQKVFTALLPKEIAEGSRADKTAKAIVSLMKYRAGVPFYRQQQMQEILAAPISASEIWEMTEEVADAALPVYSALCQEAANGDLVQNDDTSARILSVMEEIKETDAERTGTFTTTILSTLKMEAKVALFFTGRKHAGENLDKVLEKRSEELPPPIQECDALSRNIPKNHPTHVANCLSHARRKFYELVNLWPKEVLQIIGWFSELFGNEKSAPKDAQERLRWHQEKSTSLVEKIKEYCNGLTEGKKVEPNSSMGKAIAYLNNHWEALTLFLRLPGVPLTNNDTERLIKRPVLNRKNAYFFRNETGAKIADILMSLIETCALNKVNPWDYLIALQEHRKDVWKHPFEWVPWKYEARLKALFPP